MSVSERDSPAFSRRALSAEDVALDRRYGRPSGGFRLWLFSVIFQADTRSGRAFDLLLIAAILLSVLVVVLDSVQALHLRWGSVFNLLEWVFTVLFTLEYAARLICVRHKRRYALSFYGVIDLVAVLPTYLAILVPGLNALIDVRILRLLRIFRLFKLSQYAVEYRQLAQALSSSRRKIMVFVGVVLMVVLVLGTLMYVVEGPQHGFTSIPVAVYWAISTMTTVGFGDLVPKSDLGRAIASFMMLLGWGVLAVPTGIVSAEMMRSGRDAVAEAAQARLRSQPGGELYPRVPSIDSDAEGPVNAPTCPACSLDGHAPDALFCRRCAEPLRPAASAILQQPA
ncbi:MAG: ion transporter [Variovorax sp.]